MIRYLSLDIICSLKLTENCEPQGTDNVRGQLLRQLFALNGGYSPFVIFILFYDQYANRHMNLKFVRCVSKREREIRQFVIVKKIDVSF